ncbi:hypothetical protein BH10ACI1_BH10ACI1_15970 [soil metagenome]
MLDKLIESKSHIQENKKLNGLLATIFMTAAIGLTFAFVYSLFSQELFLGNGDLELMSLVAPEMVEEIKPEPQVQQKQTVSQKVTNNVPTRVENIQRPEESPIKPPDTVSVVPSKNQARPNTFFKIGKGDFTPSSPTTATTTREGNSSGNSEGISTKTPTVLDKNDETDIPVVKKPVEKIEPKKNVIVSRGVINGEAKYLAQPTYSQAARAVRAEGRVEVQVTIDENGRVIAANVIKGHTLLRDSALSAARKSIFSPTTLSGEKVKVTGIIIYNFNAQ